MRQAKTQRHPRRHSRRLHIDATTPVLTPDAAGIARAADLLAQGALVAVPTETVYGLGADATREAAAEAVFAAKGRPATNPLIVHVADREAAERVAVFDARADALAAAFWPGPLTLVLPARPGLAAAVTAGRATVAVRMPAHPVARALLAAFGGPVAAPSANRSGRLSPTSADDVLAELGGRIAAVLDGGRCDVGVESTIVGLAEPVARLLRPGGIPVEALAACLGTPLAKASEDGPAGPGEAASHYAPVSRVRLDAEAPRDGEVHVTFGTGGALSLSPAGDLAEAARNLFAVLRAADGLAGGRGIAVAPVPDSGLGRAINDRLRRAAAPRP